MTIFALGFAHIASRSSQIALCGLPARLPEPLRPAPPCIWCEHAAMLGHKSDGGRTNAGRFTVHSVLRRVERTAIERF